jgi:TetR/AcrR family transcriptional regulator
MELTTEQKILTAAKAVFTEKGYAGARMQEIADTADINKGLLHYYFKSKEKLFTAIFDQAFEKFAGRINEIFDADLPFLEKIDAFVDNYMNTMIEAPYLPSFILNELNNNREAFVQHLLEKKIRPNPMKLFIQIQAEIQAGTIRPINPIDLVLNIISMCAFPFVAKPLLQTFAQVDDATYQQLLEMRKTTIKTFVKQAIQNIP